MKYYTEPRGKEHSVCNKIRKVNFIGNILRRNCRLNTFLKEVRKMDISKGKTRKKTRAATG